ncbi:uncharacterized protein LACBIDRAFT_298459 [Laccaria bicolor S238N-H82]|uniref:Predicted protein n=1 Tax=Laccaria bicolor (strain S238N-H82 / ATCC MYA-4686) TaxID=486041 RepID=B0DCW7_LACBS|nr:uncharacterized protein LACBIDRAFT_298459 [Laccaria bicolor S238N-H82]EDR07370.1 predicted protein [Laccaria bicolor S238N-H82]|eukprot:XP_001881762.1 predicted protein [Laccaria bicolor S238N-H82]
MTTLGSMALRPYLRLFAVSTNHRFVISSLVSSRPAFCPFDRGCLLVRSRALVQR